MGPVPSTRDRRFTDGRHVLVTHPAPVAAWEEVLRADPTAMPFHTHRWLQSIEAATNWRDATRLYELPDGRRLILLMVRRGGVRGMPVIQASWPAGWGSGGILAPGGVRPYEVAAVVSDLAGHAVSTRVRPAFGQTAAWANAGIRVGSVCSTIHREVHLARLTGTYDDYLSTRLSKSMRSHLRRAARNQQAAGLTVESGNSPELARDFYAVYTTWLRRRATRRRIPAALALWRGRNAEPWERFLAVAENAGDDCRFSVASIAGRPVGGNVMLARGQIAVGWRAYSDHDVPGRLLISESLDMMDLEHAYERGCRYMELGESGGRQALANIKVRIGGFPHPFDEYRFERRSLTRLEAIYGASATATDQLLTRTAAHIRNGRSE